MIDPCHPEDTSPASAPDTLPTGAPQLDGFAAIQLIPARHFTPGRTAAVSLIVIHTTENDCRPGVALAVARYFAGPSAPEASAHYVVDPGAVVQCVRDVDTAWHAPGTNPRAIGIEHAGRARYLDRDWETLDVDAMLRRSAGLVAALCRRHGIPIERLGAEAVRAGEAGITGHVDVSKAFKKSDHWDPGPRFPWARYLDLVRAS